MKMATTLSQKKEKSTSKELADTLPGLDFVPPNDRQGQVRKGDQRNAVTGL
jgi:hypothetical protein